MQRKKFSIHKTFTILLLTIIIFSIGIIVGNQTTHQKYSTVLDLTEELQLQTLAVEVEYDILEENICRNDDILYLTEELFELSEKIDYMENDLGSDHPRVSELKQHYFIVEAKHWLLAKKRIDECFENNITLNNTIVLYFYSNKGDCPRCQQQGAVISYLHEEYEGMKVYSFDATSQSPVVKTLKKIYTVQGELPGLVINDETVQGYLNADEFIAIVNQQINRQEELEKEEEKEQKG